MRVAGGWGEGEGGGGEERIDMVGFRGGAFGVRLCMQGGCI